MSFEKTYEVNSNENNPPLRFQSVEDILRDGSIPSFEKHRVLKCFKYVQEWVDLSGNEPINGNVCITADNVFRCIKIHADRTVSHVKIMEGNRDDYVTLGLK